MNFKAVALIKMGRAEPAASLLQLVLQIQPDHLAAQVNLSRLQIDQGNYAIAIIALQPLVLANPQHKVAV
ncbi:tetratricopeptide repeat protein, partial [Flavobacterium sp. LMO6]|nr:tetratricopeptide repeat protein [Flavobacterium sp. LMO6]